VAFVFNALSFLFSAFFIGRLRSPGGSGFTASRDAIEPRERHPLRDYVDGLRYMRSVPLLFALALVGVGWATGGGAAQILFSLFGEVVFKRGAAGIGEIWAARASASFSAHPGQHVGPQAEFRALQMAGRDLLHRAWRQLHPIQSESQLRAGAGLHRLSRLSIAVSNVLNMTQVLRHTPDAYRGRVTSTMESMFGRP